MAVKLLFDWLGRKAGDVIDLGIEVDEKLVKKGKAEAIETRKPEEKAKEPKGYK